MITVCICTYNRASSLKRTLESLAAQTGVDWRCNEVLIINNNCTDATANTVNDSINDLPVRQVVESRQGLSHARNRALATARGEWIIFTDDDVLLDPRWLSEYRKGLDDFPDAAFAAGRVIPEWRKAAPCWFRGERLAYFDGLLVWCDKGTENRYLEPDEPGLVGASFAIRRDSIGHERFRADLGHRGDAFGRGEETEFVLRLQNRGVRGAYIGRALCRHPVDFRRLTLRGLYVHGVASGRAQRRISGGQGSYAHAGLYLARGLLQLARGRGDRFRQCVINAGVQVGLTEPPT